MLKNCTIKNYFSNFKIKKLKNFIKILKITQFFINFNNYLIIFKNFYIIVL